jgi:signal transduction histidine kinase
MTGTHLINRIRRQSGPSGRMLVLAATAFDNPSRRIELFHLGVDDYIAKPIVPLELKARVQNLLTRKQAVEQNQHLLEATQLGVMVIDAQGIIESVDANAMAMFSVSEGGAVGQQVTTLVRNDGGLGASAFSPGLRRIRKTGLRHGGEPFPIEITVISLSQDAADDRRALLTRDVSEELQLAEYLTTAKEAAELAGRLKSEFLADMSHEIRTPLNAIVGMAHLMRRAGLPPEQEGRLDKIDAAGHHLLDVINSILDLSKIEAGRFTLEEAHVAVGVIPANVASILTSAAQAKHLQLRIETQPLPAPVLGDSVRLQQALLNYAGNAIKFTDSGSITLRVRPEVEHDDSIVVRFEVEDTGIGLSPEAAKRIFSAFEQADATTARKYGGTGLGLAITKRLAQLMGGEAGVVSTVGQGSTFWFTARLKKDATGTACALQDGNDTAENVLLKEFSGWKILLAEDEPINREVALALLEDVAQSVDVALDGVEAVALAQANGYNLILMDMQMPRMEGLEATRQIRLLPQAAAIPIIAMTANAFNEDRNHCFEAGMNDFISKPVSPEVLFETILKWYRRS